MLSNFCIHRQGLDVCMHMRMPCLDIVVIRAFQVCQLTKIHRRNLHVNAKGMLETIKDLSLLLDYIFVLNREGTITETWCFWSCSKCFQTSTGFKFLGERLHSFMQPLKLWSIRLRELVEILFSCHYQILTNYSQSFIGFQRRYIHIVFWQGYLS